MFKPGEARIKTPIKPKIKSATNALVKTAELKKDVKAGKNAKPSKSQLQTKEENKMAENPSPTKTEPRMTNFTGKIKKPELQPTTLLDQSKKSVIAKLVEGSRIGALRLHDQASKSQSENFIKQPAKQTAVVAKKEASKSMIWVDHDNSQSKGSQQKDESWNKSTSKQNITDSTINDQRNKTQQSRPSNLMPDMFLENNSRGDPSNMSSDFNANMLLNKKDISCSLIEDTKDKREQNSMNGLARQNQALEARLSTLSGLASKRRSSGQPMKISEKIKLDNISFSEIHAPRISHNDFFPVASDTYKNQAMSSPNNVHKFSEPELLSILSEKEIAQQNARRSEMPNPRSYNPYGDAKKNSIFSDIPLKEGANCDFKKKLAGGQAVFESAVDIKEKRTTNVSFKFNAFPKEFFDSEPPGNKLHGKDPDRLESITQSTHQIHGNLKRNSLYDLVPEARESSFGNTENVKVLSRIMQRSKAGSDPNPKKPIEIRQKTPVRKLPNDKGKNAYSDKIVPNKKPLNKNNLSGISDNENGMSPTSKSQNSNNKSGTGSSEPNSRNNDPFKNFSNMFGIPNDEPRNKNGTSVVFNLSASKVNSCDGKFSNSESVVNALNVTDFIKKIGEKSPSIVSNAQELANVVGRESRSTSQSPRSPSISKISNLLEVSEVSQSGKTSTDKKASRSTSTPPLPQKPSQNLERSSCLTKKPTRNLIEWIISSSSTIPTVPKACTDINTGTPLIDSFGFNSHKGFVRNYNEDRISISHKLADKLRKKIRTFRNQEIETVAFFSLFDGHGGKECSDFLQQELHKRLMEEVKFGSANFLDSIKKFYANIDSQYLKFASKSGTYYSGSCATSLIFVNSILFSVNLGDSRSIMSLKGGKLIKDLTRDHKPEATEEFKRIMAVNGKIYRSVWSPITGRTVDEFAKNFEELKKLEGSTHLYKTFDFGPWRLYPGGLSVSRSFGDFESKSAACGGVTGCLICEPEIFECSLVDADFIVMGCFLKRRRHL